MQGFQPLHRSHEIGKASSLDGRQHAGEMEEAAGS